ncbi:aromatic-ring-hydroxylating dioxygenase subunit beta [Roseibium sp. M-1]
MLDILSDEPAAADTADLEYYSMEWYERLQAIVEFWRELSEIPEQMIPSEALRGTIERLLFLEARLLDQERLEEWLELYTDDATYWIPADNSASDPRFTVSWEMNDRRRLEERVERLATERAYSQAPTTRATHLYTNIEVLSFSDELAHVLCNFVIQTSLVGNVTHRSGWNGFILRKVDDEWRIALKRINLFDADHAQENNSFTL